MVVDTSALLAVIFDEPECEGFVRILLRDPSPIMGAPTVLETSIVTADRVGTKGLSRLRRTMRTLNFGDCLSYAVAKTRRRRLLYKGDDFSHTDIERAA